MEEQKIRSIRELAPKPSDAIKAMLDGLQNIPSADFRVNMNTFGRVEEDGERLICCGCAATCAVFQLAGKSPMPDVIEREFPQARYLAFDYGDLVEFENAIDAFRVGNASMLFKYYGIRPRPGDTPDELWNYQSWHLSTHYWRQQLPMIEAYRDKLVAAGL